MPDLQILVPLFNKADYVKAALNSILNQKTKYSYEIIISDDASTDASIPIIRRMLENHPQQIRLITNDENGGCLANTLKCYERISSRYFTVLDPDDLWIDETHIERAISFLEANPDFDVFMSNTSIEEKGESRTYISGPTRSFDFGDLDQFVPGHTSATFFRNRGALSDCINTLRSKIGTPQERLYEGDTFRSMLHLSRGKGYFDNTVRSIYRITSSGIWAGQSEFISQSLNTQFFLEMYKFFNGQNAAFFLRRAEAFANHALMLTNTADSKVSSDDLNRLYKTYLSIVRSKNNLLEPAARPAFVFFLPSRTLGGYEFLFTRLARTLSDDLNYIVFFIDYPDGIPRSLLSDSKITMLDHIGPANALNLGRTYTLVIPTTLGFELPKIVDVDVRILSWFAHPKSVEWLCARSSEPLARAKEHLDQLNAANALMFMDWACWKAAERELSTTYKENYVPVFAPSKQIFKTTGHQNPNLINVAWLGRLDDDKAPAIEALITNMSAACSNYPVHLHIIGDGNSRRRIESMSADLPFPVTFLGTVTGPQLDDYLINKIDIMFALGISALEAANLKIPTVLNFLSADNSEYDAYLWLFESPNFSLGMYLSELEDSGIRTHTLSEVLSAVTTPDAVSDFGDKCYEYSIAKHSEPSVLCRLIEANNVAGQISSMKSDLETTSTPGTVTEKAPALDMHQPVDANKTSDGEKIRESLELKQITLRHKLIELFDRLMRRGR